MQEERKPEHIPSSSASADHWHMPQVNCSLRRRHPECRSAWWLGRCVENNRPNQCICLLSVRSAIKASPSSRLWTEKHGVAALGARPKRHRYPVYLGEGGRLFHAMLNLLSIRADGFLWKMAWKKALRLSALLSGTLIPIMGCAALFGKGPTSNGSRYR